MADSHTPLLQIDGALARVTLRRPRLAKRLELADLQTLTELLSRIEADPAVRVLLLQAEGRHFCSGFHIDAVPGVNAGALFEALTQAGRRPGR